MRKDTPPTPSQEIPRVLEAVQEPGMKTKYSFLNHTITGTVHMALCDLGYRFFKNDSGPLVTSRNGIRKLTPESRTVVHGAQY